MHKSHYCLFQWFVCSAHYIVLGYNQSYDVLQNVKTGLRVMKTIFMHNSQYCLFLWPVYSARYIVLGHRVTMCCRTLKRDFALWNKSYYCLFFCDLYIPHIMLRNNQRNDVLQNDWTGLRITRPIPRHRSHYCLYDLYIPYTKFSRNNQSYDVLQNVWTGLCVTKPIPEHKLYYCLFLQRVYPVQCMFLQWIFYQLKNPETQQCKQQKRE